ncbi:MAG TPA: hypothetical protein VKA46_06180 [Gemmataceae bacterium]|nr:hypothetical protein [Gemmataceae bacterium]
MKIGWFTPFDPGSAVGDYSEAVIAGLSAAGDEVTVFATEAPAHGEPRPSRFPVIRPAPPLPPSFLERLGRFDLLVFSLCSSPPDHRTVAEVAARRPGLVVLHDLALLQPALRRCLGVVVHSDYALRRVREAVAAPSAKIDLPLCGPAVRLAARLPAPARPAHDRVRLLTVGDIAPQRMVHATLRAIRRSDLLREQVSYRVIGKTADESYAQRLQSLVRLYGLGGEVELAEGPPAEALAGADVVISLRNPDLGDNPAGLIDSLVAGLPTVVWDHGFFGDFPADVVCKISLEEEIGPLLERLVGDLGRRQELGRAARAYALERFHSGRYCERFRAFAEQALRHGPLLGLVDHVSDRLLELGTEPMDGLAERLAAELSLFAPDEERPAAPARARVPQIPEALAG